MRKFAFLGVVILLLPVVSGAATKQAADVIIDASKTVIARISANQEQIMANHDLMYQLVDELIVPHFDFVSMSKWVLGKKHWSASSKEEHEEFVREFKKLLIRTYSKTLLEYPNKVVEYISTEKNPQSPLVVVKTRIASGKGEFLPIDYRMHLHNEQWKVIDVVLDGISLVSAYHGSFKSEIEKNGFAGLLQKLRERNARNAK